MIQTIDWTRTTERGLMRRCSGGRCSRRCRRRRGRGPALEPPDGLEEGEDVVVREKDQMSLSVEVIGTPNAGKSSLTNLMIEAIAIKAAIDEITQDETLQLVEGFTIFSDCRYGQGN